MKEKLKDIITYASLEQVVNALSDTLCSYDITPVCTDNVEKDVLLDAYISAIRVEGRSEKTLQRYKSIIGQFLKHAGTSTKNITQYHIRNYLAHEKERGLADMSVKSMFWVLSSYFGWLHRDGIITKNPAGNIGNIKVQKKVKHVFSDIDIEKMKSATTRIRDKAIISFLQSTACRISEVTNLNIEDIDFVKKECIVLGKGNKQRVVYMDDVTAMYLKQYIATRKDNNPALFIGIRKNRISPGGVRSMLKTVGKKADVEHVHPHKFRRTRITSLVTRGMPIEQVKFLVGHEKIDTTMAYVVMDQNNVRNNFNKYA